MALHGTTVIMEKETSVSDAETDDGHYDECDRVIRLDGSCQCDAINAEMEAYYAEPRNMADLEDGIDTTPIW